MEEQSGSSTLDFTPMSQRELLAARNRINRAKFPANFEACEREIQKRKDAGMWSDAPVDAAAKIPRKQFPLLRRFVADFFDSMTIMAVSLLFFPFSDAMSRLGYFGAFPVILLTFAYVTSFEGPTGGGQSFGKKLTYLKVTDAKGAVLSWKYAAVRGLFFVLLISKGFQVGSGFGELVLQGIFSVGATSIALINLLFLCVHPQRRSLVEIWSNSIVQDIDYAIPGKLEEYSQVWKRKIPLGIVVVLVAAMTWSTIYTIRADPMSSDVGALAMSSEIESSTGARLIRYANQAQMGGQAVSSGTQYFFWIPPEDFGDRTKLTVKAEKIRTFLNEPRFAMAPGPKNIFFAGTRYYGLIPSVTMLPFFENKKP